MNDAVTDFKKTEKPILTAREKLLARKDRIENQLALMDARDKEKRRKQRTRRLIILGGAIEAAADLDPQLQERVNAVLRDKVKKQDRKYFGEIWPEGK